MSSAHARHERLTELFGEAIELGAAERAALIERVRGEDGALADELVALLAADEQAGASEGLQTAGFARAVDRRRSEPGIPLFAVPGYRMLEVLGEGGMGTVYAAEQAEPRRRVAIKVLYARSQNAVARFKAEAQIMARLDHQGIARVLEAGEVDDRPYLVMEHVDGQTLDAHARGRSIDQKLALFVAMCDAVHHAHVKGVIHRDLKPSNVMVRADGRVVVLDFGVARLAADDGSSPGDTRAGDLIGTPLYMSPEQARMHADAVDARSDVYTLGVILYELLSGQLPYDIRDLPLGVVTSVISEDPPVPLARRDSELAGDLDAITQKALAKAPEDRYASVAAMADDVRRFRAGLPVSVRVPGPLERARRFVRRRPLVAAGIAGATVATLTFAGVVTVLWLEARGARRTAENARAVTESARGTLESRANQLVLDTAREALGRDPTEALAWLATLTPRDVDAVSAWAIFDEAVARGVASDVIAADADEVHWIEPLVSGGFVTGSYDGRAVLWTQSVAGAGGGGGSRAGTGPGDEDGGGAGGRVGVSAGSFAPRVLVTAKKGRVHAARPSPDGALVAVGCDDGEGEVVTRDGRVVATLSGHVGDVQHLAWSPDGAWLVTGDDHGNAWVWPHGATPGRRLADSHSPIGAVAFSADSHALVVADHDGRVWLWRTDPWDVRTAQLDGDPQVAWTDGGAVAIVDAEGTVHRWHVAAPGTGAKRATGGAGASGARNPSDPSGAAHGAPPADELVADLPIVTHRRIKRAAFSPDGTWLALGGVGGEVTRVTLGAPTPSGPTTGSVTNPRAHVGAPATAAATGTTTTGADPSAHVGAAGDGAAIETLGKHATQVRSLAISDDARWIADGGEDGSLVLRELATGREIDLPGHRGRIRHVAFVAAAGSGAPIALLSSDSEGVVRRWIIAAAASPNNAPATMTSAAASSPSAIGGTPSLFRAGATVETLAADGAQLAGVDANGDVWRWTLANGRSVRLGHADGRVTALALAGDTVITGTAEGTVTWWAAAVPAQLATTQGATSSPTPAQLAATQGATTAPATQGATTAPAPVIQHVRGIARSIAVATRGTGATTTTSIAVGTSAGPIELFSAAGAPLATLPGNPGGTEVVAFARRGELLASAGQDHAVRLWLRDVTGTYALAHVLEGFRGDVHFVAFTPAGDRVIGASDDGAVLAWPLDRMGAPGPSQLLAQHVGTVTALAIDPDGKWLASAGRDHTVTRTPLASGAPRSSQLSATAVALAIDPDGELAAISGAGTVEHTIGTRSIAETEHGAHTALQLGRDRWAIALADGTIVILQLQARPLAALAPAIAAATRFRYR